MKVTTMNKASSDYCRQYLARLRLGHEAIVSDSAGLGAGAPRGDVPIENHTEPHPIDHMVNFQPDGEFHLGSNIASCHVAVPCLMPTTSPEQMPKC